MWGKQRDGGGHRAPAPRLGLGTVGSGSGCLASRGVKPLRREGGSMGRD